MNSTRRCNPEYPTIAADVERGQVRLVGTDGTVAVAVRHGMGWTVLHGAMQRQAATLDVALIQLDMLPCPSHRHDTGMWP